MINKPTVLVLGAGASVDYGFPTGEGLLNNICRDTQERDGSLFAFFTERMELPRAQIANFSEALSKSNAPSVDLFLENRPELQEIGKLAIAASLIPHESFGHFVKRPDPYNRKPYRSWYKTLFQLMVEGGHFEENRLSVITFNYDRSLEAFFFQSLTNLKGLDNEAAQKLVSKIPIIHLYGSLGDRLIGDEQHRGYQPTLQGNWVQDAAKRIKIVHQAKPGQEFDDAQVLLQQAREILFLGFGFHPVNVTRLRLQEAAAWQRTKSIESRWLVCRTGMGNGDVARAATHLNDTGIEFAEHPEWDITSFLSNTNCLNFA